MASDLSWNLHGNDQLSGVLEKLERTLGKVSRKLDDTTADAKATGRALDNVETGSSRASRGLERVSRAASAVGSRLSAARQMVMSYGTASVLVLGAAGVAAGKYALDVAAANETAAISFEVLFGSAQKSQKFLAKLQAFAASTPFEMPELRESASRLLAVGFNAEKIIPLLTRLGDATAAMGTGSEGISRAVYALQQMSQAGKVSLEDINQLTDAGIPALDALSAKLGVTVAQLREQISAGKIKPDQLFDAILQGAGKTFPRLQGMMTRQSATLTGIWSTFQDNTGQALAHFAEPAIPGIKRVIDWTATNLPKALDWIREQGSKANSWLEHTGLKTSFIQSMKDLGAKVLPALKEGWRDLTKWTDEHRDDLEKIGRWITTVGIPVFGDGLVSAIHLTVDALTTFGDAAITAFDGFLWLTRRALAAMKWMIDGAAAAFGWIPELGPKLKKAATDFDKWSADVLDKMNRLDGKTIDITMNVTARTHGDLEFSEGNGPSGSSSKPQVIFQTPVWGGGSQRASGGPVWKGRTYRGNEYGVEEFYAAQTGYVTDANTTRQRAAGGGGDGVLGVLIVRHVTPTGEVMREELLQLKRRRGLGGLGLA